MSRSAQLSVLALAAVLSAGVQAPAAPQEPATNQQASAHLESAKLVWEHLDKSPASLAEVETLALWSRRLAEAAAENGLVPLAQARAEHLARMQETLGTTRVLWEAGRRSPIDVAAIQFHVEEAKKLREGK